MKKFLLAIICINLTINALAQVTDFVQEGKASFYADKFEGRTTASGERYSHKKSTCAHLSLPFGTLLKVTNLANNRSAVVRVNDRGPFVPDRIVDLSRSVAERLDFVQNGVTQVKIETINNQGEQLMDQPETLPKQLQKQQTQLVSNNQINNQTQRPSAPNPEAKQKADAQNSINSEFFEVKSTKIDPSGYTVQIASYKELVSVLRIAAEVEKALNQKVQVQVTSLKGERIYRIMAGNFANANDARKFKEKASKIYHDCFVVQLNAN